MSADKVLCFVFCVTLALASITPSAWGCSDSSTGTDKAAHFGLGFVAGSVITSATSDWKWGTLYPLALMVGKEWMDSKEVGGHFCGKDLAAGVLGAVIGSLTSRWAVSVQIDTYKRGLGFARRF